MTKCDHACGCGHKVTKKGMSESDSDQVARSLALEQAYVHEVYEQCAEKTVQGKQWPRIYQFLEELEPGALVCDIGCGNGKYLNVNHSVYKVGVDRCNRLTDIAREKENEVLICDNLSLPFRDESFDAVLSIAVVHHFATTERRVRALKELARVLRIGGRLIISVWAMEQKHRKFESQDVLVPWPKAYCLSSRSSSGRSYGSSCDEKHREHPEKHILKRSNQRKCKNKSYWTDPIFSPSPSTSSLSSPNETCYSFFRRALQKLAGGRRGSRPWFIENWQNGGNKNRRHYEQEDSGDMDDMPIELRRLEDTTLTTLNSSNSSSNSKQSESLSIKSKSLGDILEIQRLDLVRSRSSIPGLCSTMTSELQLDDDSMTTTTTTTTTLSSLSTSKPRLVKQKTHFNDDDNVDVENCLEFPDNTANEQIIKDLPDIQDSQNTKRGNVQKQSSMNEELMSIERLEEKEQLRRNITKQSSLNEDIIYKRKAFEAFRESFYSGNASKRFQLLKSGLTNKIKQSTTNIEKVSGMSIRNGFVKILQSWKSTESEVPVSTNVEYTIQAENLQNTIKRDHDLIERRLSREDGSDSSKDSSLQSDTSVDSEDSFASVIYVPKQDVTPLIDVITATAAASPPGYQLSTASAPPSPRVKYPPDLTGPRLKMISISPLLKQFPATSKSLPPPSPPGLSPKTLNSTPMKPFINHRNSNQPIINFLDKKFDFTFKKEENLSKENIEERNLNFDYDDTNLEKKIPEEKNNEEECRKDRLKQIKELLYQKPGFATRMKPSFPLVRRASSAVPGRLETATKLLPRLLSLELFNPETDDLDSDSSGVSSPESGGSVISVISDERYLAKKNKSDITSDDIKETSSSNNDSSSSSSKLLEAAANVASSLENVAGTVVYQQKINDDLSIKKHNLAPSPDEVTWNEECRKHLLDFTEKLSENLIHDIDQYCQKTKLEINGDFDQLNLQKKSSQDSYDYLEFDNKPDSLDDDELIDRSVSEERMDFVMISKNGDIINETEVERKTHDGKLKEKYLRFGNSIESSDIGDSIENTISESSQGSTRRIGSGSTASLGSSNLDFSRCISERRKFLSQNRSASEEIPSKFISGRNHFERSRMTNGASNGTLSGSSSQESLPSDQGGGGGAITYHQYYHVFREGELDQLINKYVENLHIISSYYDHASWCIVAEKVQVWTI
ncbi:uncharacterized protein LOC127280492 isoform X2 [Leptopilina boulardi]|uniref:uncharacterized protein LOC127280492 isoform X2 n=1 Tax=Leptopilina boulardi TaxID=63433 RepID=UPI0021F59E7E|nr:uncharacterized protein LOC127280492 isoform X2 [Leptopilina boulardi]